MNQLRQLFASILERIIRAKDNSDELQTNPAIQPDTNCACSRKQKVHTCGKLERVPAYYYINGEMKEVGCQRPARMECNASNKGGNK